MSLTVFLVVLLAAMLHALWNALVKGGGDKGVSMAAVVIGQGLFGLLALPFAPAPDIACWPFLLGGVALHLGYQTFLLAAYRVGDLTQVYPIARGVAPMLVAAVSTIFLGVHLSALETLAVAVIAIGVASLGLTGRSDGALNGQAALLAVVTGGFIAAYSMLDGLGARVAGTPLGFYGWLAALNAVGFILFAVIRRPGLVTKGLRARRTLVIGGGASFTAYALVVFAFTEAPIALVTALRETSIVFALGIGVIVLKEPVNFAKVTATAVTLAGAALLRFSKG